MLGDVIIVEPKAYIAFASKGIIEQNIKSQNTYWCDLTIMQPWGEYTNASVIAHLAGAWLPHLKDSTH